MNDVLPIRSAHELRADVARRVVHYRRRRRAAFAVPVVAVAMLLGTLATANRLSSLQHSVRTGIADDGRAATTTAGESDQAVEAGPLPASDRSAPSGPSMSGDASVGWPLGSAAPTTNSVTPRQTPSREAPARMAFVRGGELHLQRTDGSGLRRIAGAAGTPAWAPGGRVLAFSEPLPQGGHRVATVDVTSDGRRVVAEEKDASFTDPAWSPDGTRIAVTRRPRLETGAPGGAPSVWTVDVASGTRRLVADGARPSWSPEGRLVFDCATGLCLSDADGARQAPIPASNGLSEAAWSPDGEWLAAIDDTLRLIVIRPNGSARRVVAEGVRGGPAWFPGGGRLAFPAKAAVDVRGIWSVDIDGNGRRQLTTEAGDDGPSLASD